MPDSEHTQPFDAATVLGVVDHMNDDHQDACLAIVRAFSIHTHAINARMLTLDRQGMEFEVQTVSNKCSADTNTQTVRIPFGRTLQLDNQIRGQLVAMTRQARAQLSG